MRYDTPVDFIKRSSNSYDPVSGTLGGQEVVIGHKTCHMHDLTATEKNDLLGRLDRRGAALHHQGHMIDDAQFVRIHGKLYTIRSRRELVMKASYIVEEVE